MNNNFKISQILHVSVIVADTETSLRFYRDILGLIVDHSRSDLGYPGAWLHVGAQQIHLLQVPNPDPTTARPQHGGRDRHAAFAVIQFDELTARLAANQIPHTLSRSGRRALFCRDPDGNTLEFIAAEK